MAMQPEDRKFLSRLQLDSMLIGELAFVNSLLLQMPLNVSHDEKTTVQANDMDLIVNPDYLKGLNKKQQMYAMSQLAWHMAMMDPVNVKNAEHPELYNQAADIYIDQMLMKDHGRHLERVEGIAPRPEFDGMTRDEIYRKLVEEANDKNDSSQNNNSQGGISNDLTKPRPSDAQGDSDSPSQDGGPQDGQGQPQPMSTQELKDKLEDMVKNAAMQAKLAGGKVPQDVEKLLDAIYNPQIPWHQVLERLVGAYKREDFSWSRFHKGMFAHGYIVPTLFNESVGDIVIAADTSGSISDEAYQHILGNIQFIHTHLRPDRVHLLQFTESIHAEMEVAEGDDLDENIFKRVYGGTDVNPVFDWIEEKGIKPEIVIVFTDMYMPAVKHDPAYPVIWGVIDNPTCTIPFGDRVDIQCH